MSAPGIRGRFKLRRGSFQLDVDFEIPFHGVTALFGPSGSGKTTLLRLVAGLDRDPHGVLTVLGETWQNGNVFVAPHRRALGYVFQDANLFPHLSARKNLEYGWKRIPLTDRRIPLDHVIDLLGIEPFLDRNPASLSGGERQRVGIARALATSPRLLLMDEPLAALDLARKKEILPYLEKLRDDLSMPMVYVSHAADEVTRLADHLVFLENGNVVAQGPITQVLSRVDLPIRLGDEAGVVIMAKVGERSAQWNLAKLDFQGGSLWSRDQGVPVGQAVRVRVLARDVSVSLERSMDTSILNILPGRVDSIGEGEHKAQAMVRILLAGNEAILARLTHRSIDQLGLSPGKNVWTQIKTVALME
jgi:molybdate transport system ATP-binding protein